MSGLFLEVIYLPENDPFDRTNALDVAVRGCDECKIRKAEYKSLGGSKFCKKCADDLGLICGEGNRIKD